MRRRTNCQDFFRLIIFALPLVCHATPAPPCAPDSLFQYISLAGGCTVGNALLSNFSYNVTGNGSNLAPTASQVTVTPTAIDTLTSQLVFTADPTWSLIGPAGGTGNNSYNAFLSFTITAPVTWGVVNVSLSATGLDQTGGAGKIVETLSNGQQLQVSHFPNTLTTLTDPGSPFAPVPTLDTTKKIQLSNGSLQGNEFTEISQTVTLVTPEPRSFYLVGLAGLGLFLFRKRRNTATARL